MGINNRLSQIWETAHTLTKARQMAKRGTERPRQKDTNPWQPLLLVAFVSGGTALPQKWRRREQERRRSHLLRTHNKHDEIEYR